MTEADPLRIGVSVGDVVARKYRVDRVLGAGGMGVVVAATDMQLDRQVAIKLLLPEALANPEIVGRFSREARAAAKIHSEHVARVIDVGVLESGAPYMVMEYLEGTDLAQRIAAHGPLAPAEAARTVLEACEALAEAHAAGIVHRDLKPANLFLARRPDRSVTVKVLDFGISKAPVGGGGVTSTRAVMGSPHYMSPEQLVSAKHVDARSDIWSLGIVLYEALVGSPPYVADTMPEIVAKILQTPTPSVRALRPELPAEIERVVERCMAKDPARR
ncbi:MAG TPA: serine/threonine-protein kinase, partial [Gaiellaceae bacterium]|nr:serine/threonine-protein kinase [Gaiellaceae bacterium]